MTQKAFTDLRSIIAQAGGTNHVARQCSVTSSAVSQWIKRGSLPLSEIAGRTNHSETLASLLGVGKDAANKIRLIGRQ